MADTEKVQDSAPIQFRSVKEIHPSIPLDDGALYRCEIFLDQVRLIRVERPRSVFVVRISDSEYWHELECFDGHEPKGSFRLRSV